MPFLMKEYSPVDKLLLTDTDARTEGQESNDTVPKTEREFPKRAKPEVGRHRMNVEDRKDRQLVMSDEKTGKFPPM